MNWRKYKIGKNYSGHTVMAIGHGGCEMGLSLRLCGAGRIRGCAGHDGCVSGGFKSM